VLIGKMKQRATGRAAIEAPAVPAQRPVAEKTV